MSHVLEQKFYRVKSSGRGIRQELLVQIPDFDPATSVPVRRRMALDALFNLPDTRFKSGWTSWLFGTTTIVASEAVVVVEHVEVEPVEEIPIEEQDENLPELEPGTTVDAAPVVEEPVAEESVVEEMSAAWPAPESTEDEISAAKAALKPFSRFKIKTVYNDPDFPVDAVHVLQPDFEYPDWDHERVSKLWKNK